MQIFSEVWYNDSAGAESKPADAVLPTLRVGLYRKQMSALQPLVSLRTWYHDSAGAHGILILPAPKIGGICMNNISAIWEIITFVLGATLFFNMIFAIVIVFFERRDPKSVWAWLLVLFFLPGR